MSRTTILLLFRKQATGVSPGLSSELNLVGPRDSNLYSLVSGLIAFLGVSI